MGAAERKTTSIYKFGGASVCDAPGVQNVASIVERFAHGHVVLVVSAMGKSTNRLEQVVRFWFDGQRPEAAEQAGMLRDFHHEIIANLAENPASKRKLMAGVEPYFSQLFGFLSEPTPPIASYNRRYDQVVGLGELISSRILSDYLQLRGIDNQWLDAREWVVTNNTYRDARVDWEATRAAIGTLNSGEDRCRVVQGFIGRDVASGDSTTLGREGSDYTAAIFAHCLDAGELTIWKDVPGVMDADPRRFPFARLISELPYDEAVEMTYYGASVIHPKTIKPLQNKGIKLRVRSFLRPELPGTLIHEGAESGQRSPYIIVKSPQALITVRTRDFSFVAEEHLSLIYTELYRLGIKVHLMQQTALSFRFCVDDDPYKVRPLLEALSPMLETEWEGGLDLWTLRHQSDRTEKGLLSGRKILLEQRATQLVQLVLK
jgi:aspartate kinase